MKLFLEQLFAEAVDLNHENIRGLLEQDEEASFLDLGCDDCVVTALMGRHIGTRKLFGVEVMEEKAEQASSKGVTLKNFDLNKTFDFADEHFDVILSNQVIEHLHNSDNFVSEINRMANILINEFFIPPSRDRKSAGLASGRQIAARIMESRSDL